MQACSSRGQHGYLIKEGEQTRKGHWALEIELKDKNFLGVDSIRYLDIKVNLAWCYFRAQVAQWRGHLVLFAQLDSLRSAFDQLSLQQNMKKNLFLGGFKMEIINQLEGRIEIDFLASENIAYLIYSLISVSYLNNWYSFL